MQHTYLAHVGGVHPQTRKIKSTTVDVNVLTYVLILCTANVTRDSFNLV